MNEPTSLGVLVDLCFLQSLSHKLRGPMHTEVPVGELWYKFSRGAKARWV